MCRNSLCWHTFELDGFELIFVVLFVVYLVLSSESVRLSVCLSIHHMLESKLIIISLKTQSYDYNHRIGFSLSSNNLSYMS